MEPRIRLIGKYRVLRCVTLHDVFGIMNFEEIVNGILYLHYQPHHKNPAELHGMGKLERSTASP